MPVSVSIAFLKFLKEQPMGPPDAVCMKRRVTRMSG